MLKHGLFILAVSLAASGKAQADPIAPSAEATSAKESLTCHISGLFADTEANTDSAPTGLQGRPVSRKIKLDAPKVEMIAGMIAGMEEDHVYAGRIELEKGYFVTLNARLQIFNGLPDGGNLVATAWHQDGKKLSMIASGNLSQNESHRIRIQGQPDLYSETDFDLSMTNPAPYNTLLSEGRSADDLQDVAAIGKSAPAGTLLLVETRCSFQRSAPKK